MEKKFNIEKLPIDEVELLILLMEECGEVIQAASKYIRCLDYIHPNTNVSNKQQLRIELINLEIIMRKITDSILSNPLTKEVMKETKNLRDLKMEKLIKWTDVFKDIENGK